MILAVRTTGLVRSPACAGNSSGIARRRSRWRCTSTDGTALSVQPSLPSGSSVHAACLLRHPILFRYQVCRARGSFLIRYSAFGPIGVTETEDRTRPVNRGRIRPP